MYSSVPFNLKKQSLKKQSLFKKSILKLLHETVAVEVCNIALELKKNTSFPSRQWPIRSKSKSSKYQIKQSHSEWTTYPCLKLILNDITDSVKHLIGFSRNKPVNTNSHFKLKFHLICLTGSWICIVSWALGNHAWSSCTWIISAEFVPVLHIDSSTDVALQ